MSTQAPLFLLDSNIFVTAKNTYYAFDLAPSFWAALETHAKDGALATIDRVNDEIVRGEDELKVWMQKSFSEYVRYSGEEETVTHYAELQQWAQTQPFTDAARAEFADVSNADPWLIAHAKAIGATVVTLEIFDPYGKKSIKIPNACRKLDVPHINTFEMLRRLAVRF